MPKAGRATGEAGETVGRGVREGAKKAEEMRRRGLSLLLRPVVCS